jgi:hypothetical protein
VAAAPARLPRRTQFEISAATLRIPAIITMATADSGNQGARRMLWPSLEVASRIADIANLSFIGSLVVGVISTVAIVWMATVKESHWDIARQQSAERIAELNRETARLSAETEASRAAIAEANARALEAKAELEKFRASRVILPAQRAEIVSLMSKWATLPANGLSQSVAVFAVDSSFDAASLDGQIADILGANGAKWNVKRYPVMYGKSFSVSGVGILTSRNPRGMAIAEDLAKVLDDRGIRSFVMPEKRMGCEEMPNEKDQMDSNPWCSGLSVMIGEHPR